MTASAPMSSHSCRRKWKRSTWFPTIRVSGCSTATSMTTWKRGWQRCTRSSRSSARTSCCRSASKHIHQGVLQMATLRGKTQHFEVYYDNLLAFPTRGIVSVSRNANQLDLFIVGNNGVVYTDWWTAGSDWWSTANNWLPIGASFPTGAPVAAVSRNPNQLD